MSCCPGGIYRPLVIDCSGNSVLMPHGGFLRLGDIVAGFTMLEFDSTASYVADTFFENTMAFIDTSAAAFTFNLRPSTEFLPGIQYLIKKVAGGANNITVDGNGKNIDGSATQTISTQFHTLHIVSGVSDYHIIGSFN